MFPLRLLILLALVPLAACAGPGALEPAELDHDERRMFKRMREMEALNDGTSHSPHSDYTYATYDAENRLIKDPMPQFVAEARTRPISDVYVIAHGWNYTHDESIALYESFALKMKLYADYVVANGDCDYSPYFIFVSWQSVTRPLTRIYSSISFLQTPETVRAILQPIDKAVFHIFSAWGESRNAAVIARGSYIPREYPIFLDERYPQPCTSNTLYARTTLANRRKPGIDKRPVDLPLSTLIEHLIVTCEEHQGFQRRPRLHVIGHSYGAKLVTLGTLEALNRLLAHEETMCPDLSKTRFGVESLVLLMPAMTEDELHLYQTHGFVNAALSDPAGWNPLTDKREVQALDILTSGSTRLLQTLSMIRRKAVCHTARDTANGIVFPVSQAIINRRIASESDKDFFEIFRAFGSGVRNLPGRLASPFRPDPDRAAAFPHGGSDRPAAPRVDPVSNDARSRSWTITPPRYISAPVRIPLVILGWALSVAGESFGYVAGVGVTVVRTQLTNVRAILDSTVRRPFGDFLDQEFYYRAMGNAGLRTGFMERLTTDSAKDDRYTAPPTVRAVRGDGAFDELSRVPLRPDATLKDFLPGLGGTTFFSLDASNVYDTGGLAVGAHNDHRGDEAPRSGGLPKYLRTMNFIYNFTTRPIDGPPTAHARSAHR
jgi:hypothetical protein